MSSITASNIAETVVNAVVLLDQNLNIASGDENGVRGSVFPDGIGDNTTRLNTEEVLLKAGALQRAILNSANFSSIATDAKGVIQIFNVGAERMLGYAAAEVINKITPADISDPQEVIARAEALSLELGTPIKPGFEALVFKATRGIEDIYELTYIRKDGSRFPAVVSVTALRDAQDAIIGYLLIGTDNTAHKKAEKALLLANAEQTAIQTAVSDTAIVAITDTTGKIEQINDNFVRISKYSREELIGQDHRLLNSGLHPKEFFRDLWATIANGKVWRNEIRNRAKDGTLYWVDTSITPIRNKRDKLIGYMAVRFDVTARKEAEEALLQAGALQRAIYNSANFSSIATDAHGVIQIFNVGAERMLGYAAAEVIGKLTPVDLHEPQELIARAQALSAEFGTPITAGFEALVFKASRGIEDIYELTKIRNDGSQFPAVVSVTALRDAHNAIIGYLLIGTDNSARKLADDTLKTASQYARSLIEASLDPLVTISPEGKITDVNAGSVEVTGVPREKLIGTDFSNYFTEPEKAREGYQQVFALGFVTDYPLTIRHEDGRLTDVLYNASLYKDAQGEVLGVFAAARDITARKRIEAEQRKLDQRLREQTALLIEANEEIQRFVYIVSHDLRSPLVNIMGFASEIDTSRKQIFARLTELRTQVGGEQNVENDNVLNGDVEEALAFIKSSVAKMDRLIAALIKLSREGQREFLPQPIDMSQLLQSTSEALAHQARDANVKISIEDLPAITSDRLALEQIFSNLMDNAVKYMRAEVPGSIDVRATESDNSITYEIHDNGRGIDARDRDRIFDLFRRSGIQDRPGDGIGLAHARTLVRRLGGSITVESEPNRGTIFKVTLPRRWHQPTSEVVA